MKRLLVLMVVVGIMCSCGRNIHDGHEYVDLGLSVKWATCNVGASSPEDSGHHFVWGEIGASEYGSYSKKYIDDLNLNNIAGDKAHDAAAANWGGLWRMPSFKELSELTDDCKWEWTAQNGRKGYKVIGPNGNSIFLPAAGMSDGATVGGENEFGFYLGAGKSGFLNSNSIDLISVSEEGFAHSMYKFTYGASVRPVFSE
jgi:hypothetical protein